ncbi:hypothetical protein [Zooshikella sp. RANM57]|uniref:hypothetical protein n=1 Tax=Zooshikella sp. RANM57 TaxID=3425863 RepID=UPI003D6FBDB4
MENSKKLSIKIISTVFSIIPPLCAFANEPVRDNVDMTLEGTSPVYQANFADLAWNGMSTGDYAAADVMVNGADLQYTGVLLNVGAGSSNIFIKVQHQNGSGNFHYAGCYTGNNGPSFGLGFFALTRPFAKGHLEARRSSSAISIFITNAVDAGGNPVADQSYVCTGAPKPEGDRIGVHGYRGRALIDNFSNGYTILDPFFFNGSLASSGNWIDINPGMTADWNNAKGGPSARSVWAGKGCIVNDENKQF